MTLCQRGGHIVRTPGLDDAGRPLPYDPARALAHVNELAFDPQGRYWESSG